MRPDGLARDLQAQMRRDVAHRHRPAEMEALRLVAGEVAHEVELTLVLDSLDGDAHLQEMAEIDDRPDDRLDAPVRGCGRRPA